MAGALLWLNYRLMDAWVRPFVYKTPEKLPRARAALVLGTSKFRRGGGLNPYYTERIRGAARLYRQGKVKYILVSGDNGTKHYNEPRQMKADLQKEGIPPDRIYTDYAGFDTYDSMVRAHKIFGLDTMIVVSQGFHVRRAVFIGRKKGLHPWGYEVKGPRGPLTLRIFLRELLARVKAKIDILTDRNPKYLGEPVRIPQ